MELISHESYQISQLSSGIEDIHRASGQVTLLGVRKPPL